MTILTEQQQLEHYVQQAGEYATLADGYWTEYIKRLEHDPEGKRKHFRLRWQANAKFREMAEATLFRYMNLTDTDEAASEHFTARIEDVGDGRFVRLYRKTADGEEMIE